MTPAERFTELSEARLGTEKAIAEAKAARTEIGITKVVLNVALHERPIAHIDGAIRLVDRSRLILADDGEPLNVREVLDELLDRFPRLTKFEAPEEKTQRQQREYYRERAEARARRPMRLSGVRVRG